MGYEIAGGLVTKLATPDREVWVLVGDGSYLMMNSEIATSVALDKKLNIVVLDNGGFGCIDRLQRGCGGASFNNLFPNGSGVDFAGHAASLGAISRKVASLTEFEAALSEVRAARRTSVVVIATDPAVGRGGMSRFPRCPTGPRSPPPAPPMTRREPASGSSANPARLQSLRCATLKVSSGWQAAAHPALSDMASVEP